MKLCFGEGDLTVRERELVDGEASLESGNEVLLAFETDGDDKFEVVENFGGRLEETNDIFDLSLSLVFEVSFSSPFATLGAFVGACGEIIGDGGVGGPESDGGSSQAESQAELSESS